MQIDYKAKKEQEKKDYSDKNFESVCKYIDKTNKKMGYIGKHRKKHAE